MKYGLPAFCLLVSFSCFAQNTETYPVDSASVEHGNVPKGEVLHFTFGKSKVYPGTIRDYWIYVPEQYDGKKPACVYINQDGIGWNAPVVFDNLIAGHEMPVTIGVFVMHGRIKAIDSVNEQDRFNRSFEYDGLGDAYAKFLLNELLPEVEKQKTSNGRAIHLSDKGNDRCIGGASSGAVCAFTAAWEMPDQFSRVFSAIGTYVGLRGGDRYATLVRKTEPKNIRVFMQDGENDLNIYGGDWWMANQTLERALGFSGYEVMHVWGAGSHNGKQGTAIFPEAMRWLWKDWPAAVSGTESKNDLLHTLTNGNKGWMKTVSEPPGKNTMGTCLSPDHSQLYSIDSLSHWVWIHSVGKKGRLTNRQRFGWLHSTDEENLAEARGIVCDTAGKVYVATNIGVQILDQLGRVNVILPVPGGKALSVWFGGDEKNLLFIRSGSGMYSRRLNTKWADPKGSPLKPSKPNL
jgi:enterochelin esterase-like enzyme